MAAVRTFTVPAAPPYEWDRTYNAALHMANHLPGVQLTLQTTVTIGSDALHIMDDGIPLANVNVLPGTPGEESADRERWRHAIVLSAQVVASCEHNWLGVGSLLPDVASQIVGRKAALQEGDPVALLDVPGASELDGVGAVVQLKHGGRISVSVQSFEAGGLPSQPLEVPEDSVWPLPNWPFRGVSVACLRAFAAAHERQLSSASTEEVCQRICKPLTATAKDSLAACLERTQHGCAYVGHPTAFVSHARKYKFADLVDAVEEFAAAQADPDKVFVWLDIFSQYQHWISEAGSPERACNWDVVFQLTTSALRHTCLVLSPWRAPLPLERAWILWEALCTLMAGAELMVVLPPSEAATLAASLNTPGSEHFRSIWESLSTVDSRAAECFTPADQLMIHDAIEASVGHAKLNQLMFAELRRWLVASGMAALERLEPRARAESPLINNMVALLNEHGEHAAAVPLAREAAAARRGALGHHPSTYHSIGNLAHLLHGLGETGEATELCEEALAGNRAILGNTHKQTIDAILALARMREASGALDDAAQLLDEAVAACNEQPEGVDRTAVRALSSLASLRQSQGRMAEAITASRQAVDASRTLSGSRHPDTLGVLNNLALNLRVAGELEEAMLVLQQARDDCAELLGGHHPTTLSVVNNLAETMQMQGDAAGAAEYHRIALARRRVALGDEHPGTLTSMQALADCLFNLAQYAEAMELYKHALAGQTRLCGARHPNTLAATADVVKILYASHQEGEAQAVLGDSPEVALEVLGEVHELTSVLHQLKELVFETV